MHVVHTRFCKAVDVCLTPPRPCSEYRRLQRITGQPPWAQRPRLRNSLHTGSNPENNVPLRKLLKDDTRKKRALQRAEGQDTTILKDGSAAERSRLQRWRLTVGLEIHAQLNTERKSFSHARTALSNIPNSNIAPFDLAFPGCQPEFQHATIIPALRAALGLSCTIQRQSTFDRKHYYYQDQPAGYQITQYYRPFATKGCLTLHDHDGIAPDSGESVEIGIKQVQIEQDTAKSTLQSPSTALLDFNRVGHPLIEIITLPDIHHPQDAAACVRKIQAILQAVNAVTTGMEMGGLRADVNVSISPMGSDLLAQRTEIKNLSSFKAVEDAIVAERDRQIEVLESGGIIQGETRGWTLGSTESKKLRGKEGEVDYRYMPDPDIPPLIIGEDVISHVYSTLPELPEQSIKDLVQNSGLSIKDAKTLVALDDGERLEYFDKVRDSCRENNVGSSNQSIKFEKTIANWVLHEFGGLLNASNIAFSQGLVSIDAMTCILSNLDKGKITGTTAKRLLSKVFDGDERPVDTIIEQEDLRLQPLPRDEYLAIAKELLASNESKVQQIQQKKQLGKLQFFVGQMMRRGEGKMEAGKAEAILKELLGLN